MVKSLPANAGDMGLSPGSVSSHMPRSNEARAPQLLSLCSKAREPQLLSLRATTAATVAAEQLKPVCVEPLLCNKRSPHNEKPAHGKEEEPPLATRSEEHTS